MYFMMSKILSILLATLLAVVSTMMSILSSNQDFATAALDTPVSDAASQPAGDAASSAPGDTAGDGPGDTADDAAGDAVSVPLSDPEDVNLGSSGGEEDAALSRGGDDSDTSGGTGTPAADSDTSGGTESPAGDGSTGVSSVNPGETPSGETKKVKITYYWVFDPQEEGLQPEGGDVPLLDESGNEIVKVAKNLAERYTMEGTGKLADGRIINLISGSSYDSAKFRVLDSNAPWGLGASDNPLKLFKSIAANDIPQGTKIYIPILAGLKMPDGSTHDGYGIVEDESWSFDGSQIDFFAGTYNYYQEISKATGVDSAETEIIICN